MYVRASVLALPVALGLAAAAAGAATIALTPLGPSHRTTVAAFSGTCDRPDAPALATLPDPQYPVIAKLARVEGVAKIGVSLSPAGKVVHAWKNGTSGNGSLDEAALITVLAGRFTPEQTQCNRVAGDYQVEVEFSLDN